MNMVKALSLLAAVGLILGCGKEVAETIPPAPAGTSGPTLTLVDGGTATFANLAKDGPVVLYFSKSSCGSNPEAVPLVQRVYKPYEGKAKLYAVVDLPAGEYAGWRAQYGLTAAGVSDPDKSLVGHFGFKESQHLVLVEKGGSTREIEGGFGAPALLALNKELAAAAGVEAAKLDLSGVPAEAAYG